MRGVPDSFVHLLQGHIALDTAIFPEGTTGFSLDTLARLPLWKAGLDYRHGTGHGVGAALNVHEGPQVRRLWSHSSIFRSQFVYKTTTCERRQKLL